MGTISAKCLKSLYFLRNWRYNSRVMTKQRIAWTRKKKISVGITAAVAVVLVATLFTLNVVFLWYLYFYIDYKRISFSIANSSAEPGHVVFVGDSITDSCDLDEYYPTLDAYNRGIAGSTSYDVWRHLDRAVYQLQPSVVVLLVGTNDYQRYYSSDNDAILARYRQILEGIHTNSPDTKVLVQSVYPIGEGKYHKHYRYGHDYVVPLNAGLADLAAEYGYTYADVYSQLVGADGEQIADYFIDGLHPNDAGYRVISAYLLPYIQTLMQ